MPETRKDRIKVILVRSNPADRDVRSPKEIRALTQEGYVVTLLGWDRESKADTKEKPEGYKEILLKCRAPWGIKVLPLLAIWWCFVFIRLLTAKLDVVHALNVDNAIPAIIASKIRRKPVIYEILDVYEDEVVLPGLIRTVSLFVDKLFMRFADAIIVADEAQVEGIGGIPNSKIVPIYDSPPDVLSAKDINYHKNGVFTLFYAGVLYREKRLNLDKVIKVIKDIDNVRLVIAGYGDLTTEIEELSARMPDKIEFIGKIPYAEVIERGLKADLFFNLRDPVVPANRYTCGSTLLNAMSVGRPILVNRGTSTANKVYEENCGLVVDANNLEEIKGAIVKLRDSPELCRELGVNARKAYEQRYNWEIMEQRLVALYEEITRLN